MNSRLLVAHSDEELLSIYQSFFWDKGFEVEVAANVEECLVTLPEFEPDLLLIEHELRGGGSDRVISFLRDYEPKYVPSVVLLSNHRQLSDLEMFVNPPIYACLKMPVSHYKVLEAVCNLGGLQFVE
ncbi:MAG TPA: hypothetical protein VMJ32_15395 [Pirellulales bacterium]|nr:hypothetical protein [Pirellulales bacterium]